MAYHINEKRKALLANKENILRDIKYFEKRIEEARSQKSNSTYFDDDEDSDSDNISLDMGPSVTDLKLEQGRLQTCLHATQELTNLCVLQSEVNVMVNDPLYEREPPVTEQGTWHEVTAECRVDLVPFSITFYMHKSSRPFGPISYRGLRVLPVKASHENELTKSILPYVDTPSDAVEVLRSYAIAHRSRRTTLARLAEKYSNYLFMEPMAEGGYIIKCANLMEVSWKLENRWSPVAAFHHRMKFDLEYMDEAYVKIISQAHRELSDPTLETDERTRLMSKIIATCLEAQGNSQELQESMESDIESENFGKKLTTLDAEIEEPVNKKKNDSEIMAPPKTLPKKTKPKGKENNANNKKESKGVKRSAHTDNGDDGLKKAKLNQDSLVNNNKVSTKNKVDEEFPTLKKVTDNKTYDVRDDVASKTNNKEVLNTISDKEKIVANTKKSNKDNVVKVGDVNIKYNKKKKIVILKSALDVTAGNVKNNFGSSKLASVKNGVDESKNVKESAANKQNIDNQVIHAKTNINIPDIIQKNDKQQNAHKVNTKSTKSNKVYKNIEETNSAGSKKNISTKDQIQSSFHYNNEKVRKTKISSNQIDIVNKNDHLNTFGKGSDKKKNSKLTTNAKENVAIVDEDLNISNHTNNTSVINAKCRKRSKTANTTVSNSENPNAKIKFTSMKNNINVNNCDKGNAIINSSDNIINSTSKDSLNHNILNTKSYTKSNKKEKINKDGMSKNSNKQEPERENTKHVSKGNSTNSALISNNDKTYLNTEKSVNKCDSSFTNVEQDDKQVKFVVKNMNSKSVNTDKALENISKNNIATGKVNVANLQKLVKKNLAIMNKKLPTKLNKINSIEDNENRGLNLLRQTNDTNEQILYKNNYKVKNKHSKRNLNDKNITKSITNSKNFRLSKSPIHKDKIKRLNPENKIFVNRFKTVNNKQKENDLQKDSHDKNKIYTKIPQKRMTGREKIVKKIPMRISPRKSHSNLKTDSQNSSRNSLRSLQKATTGIPRLMKKTIRKE